MNNQDAPKITAFSGIFEDKLHKLVKKIKKIKRLRKEKASQAKIKMLISEAKTLKKLVNKMPNDNTRQTIEIALSVVDGKILLKESCASNGLQLYNVRYVGGLLIVEVDKV
jgi:hypothetical protein